MASTILISCTSCGDCEPACPTASISMGVNQFVIDTDSCENCLACIAICAVKAIQGQAPEKPKVRPEKSKA